MSAPPLRLLSSMAARELLAELATWCARATLKESA